MFLPGYPCGPGGPANNYIYQTHVTKRSPVYMRTVYMSNLPTGPWGPRGPGGPAKKVSEKKKLACNVTTKFHRG